MDMILSGNAYERGDDGSADVVCENLYQIAKPATDGRNFSLVPTPGLAVFADLGAPVRGIISQAGLFDGEIVAVAGTNVIRVDAAGGKTTIGTVASEGNVTLAASRTEMAICVDPALYTTDGSSTTVVSDEDLPNVTSVDHINQRFIISDDGDRYYWSDLLDGTSWDGLNFATAESEPDSLVRVYSDGERFYALGTRTTETIGAVTNPTSASDAFARLGSGVQSVGLIGIHAVAMDVETKTLAFIGHTRKVYITQGYDPQPISTQYIDERLEAATEAQIQAARLFAYSDEGTTFLVVSVPSVGTFVYNRTSRLWHTRSTANLSTWRADMHTRAFGGHYVARAGQNFIYRMNPNVFTDATTTITRRFTASLPLRASMPVRDVSLDGYAQGECNIEMRRPREGQLREYGPYVARSMQSPDQPARPTWRRFGKGLSPELRFEFRITDDVGFRIDGVRVNDGVRR